MVNCIKNRVKAYLKLQCLSEISVQFKHLNMKQSQQMNHISFMKWIIYVTGSRNGKLFDVCCEVPQVCVLGSFDLQIHEHVFIINSFIKKHTQVTFHPIKIQIYAVLDSHLCIWTICNLHCI